MNRIKYSRTFHFPWSPGCTSDDKIHKNTAALFKNKQVVVTEKLDGENSSVYADNYSHARSVDSKHHPSRNIIKEIAARIASEKIPEDMRICGENLYAKHSIAYNNLPSYFAVFGVYRGDLCLSWDETEEWCNLLDLKTAPVLYRGAYDEEQIKKCWTGKSTFSPGDLQEGYVCRTADAFLYKDFKNNVAKYVRANHVQTDEHWMFAEIIPNRLA